MSKEFFDAALAPVVAIKQEEIQRDTDKVHLLNVLAGQNEKILKMQLDSSERESRRTSREKNTMFIAILALVASVIAALASVIALFL